MEKSKYDESQKQLQEIRAELEQRETQLSDAQKQVSELSNYKFSICVDGVRTALRAWIIQSQP